MVSTIYHSTNWTLVVLDWPLVVNRLRKSRGSLEKVAREINACPVHLRRLARGETNDTKFHIAVRLLDMHFDDYPEQHRNLGI